MTTALTKLREAMLRHGVSGGELVIRVSHDAEMPHQEAKILVDRFVHNEGCPLSVAAALICIISDQSLARKN